jgi:hypothetical protein
MMPSPSGAFKAMHRLHHALNGGIEELLCGFRVEVPDDLSRVFDVGKQDRHLFAFAFQGSAGSQDLFRKMCRRVGQWGLVRGTPGWDGGWLCRGVARPDQDAAFFIHR